MTGLTQKLREDRLIFGTSCATRISNRNIARCLKTAIERAGIDNFTFHTFRHTFTTRAVKSGRDIYEVAKVLGVKDLRVIQRYIHHNVESLRNTVETVGKFSQCEGRIVVESIGKTGFEPATPASRTLTQARRKA